MYGDFYFVKSSKYWTACRLANVTIILVQVHVLSLILVTIVDCFSAGSCYHIGDGYSSAGTHPRCCSSAWTKLDKHFRYRCNWCNSEYCNFCVAYISTMLGITHQIHLLNSVGDRVSSRTIVGGRLCKRPQ